MDFSGWWSSAARLRATGLGEQLLLSVDPAGAACSCWWRCGRGIPYHRSPVKHTASTAHCTSALIMLKPRKDLQRKKHKKIPSEGRQRGSAAASCREEAQPPGAIQAFAEQRSSRTSPRRRHLHAKRSQAWSNGKLLSTLLAPRRCYGAAAGQRPATLVWPLADLRARRTCSTMLPWR
jgi:hypothetical protein